MNHEILDLVDQHDRVIAQMERHDIYKQNLKNFRVINVFLKNSHGGLWIPRRSADKTLFPLHLDVSVGGHVIAGESYEQAMQREVQEEINLLVTTQNYFELDYLNPYTHGVSAFMKVYEIQTDKTPIFNHQDFVSGDWISPKDLLHRITTSDKAKGDLQKLISLFYV